MPSAASSTRLLDGYFKSRPRTGPTPPANAWPTVRARRCAMSPSVNREAPPPTGKPPAGVRDRMRAFQRSPTEEARASALAHRPPWREVIQPLTRGPRPPATSNGDGGAQVLPSTTLVEAGLTHQRN